MTSGDAEPRYPEITVDLSKCGDTFDVEGKVHGQMKDRFYAKQVRRDFTAAVQSCQTWDEVIATTRQWVNVVGV